MTMQITKQSTARRIEEYLHHEINLPGLVDWAENALMEGEFDPAEAETLQTVIARLGVADVRAFGLSWEECEELLNRLGFTAQVSILGA